MGRIGKLELKNELSVFAGSHSRQQTRPRCNSICRRRCARSFRCAVVRRSDLKPTQVIATALRLDRKASQRLARSVRLACKLPCRNARAGTGRNFPSSISRPSRWRHLGGFTRVGRSRTYPKGASPDLLYVGKLDLGNHCPIGLDRRQI